MAEPKTATQIRQEMVQVNEDYYAQKISYEELTDRLQELGNQLVALQQDKNKALIEAGATRQEVYGKPLVPPVQPWTPESDVFRARAEAIQRGKAFDIGDALYETLVPEDKRAILAALRGDEIPEDVADYINKAIKPMTVGYHQAPDIGVSRIVDVEKGLVTDEQTGDLRQGTPAELFTEALKRQVISTTQEYEDIKRIKERELKEKNRQAQQQRLLVAQLTEEQRAKEAEIPFSVDPLGWLMRQAGLDTTQEDIAAAVKGATEQMEGDVDVAKEGVAQAMVEPYTRSGLVTESPLGAALRSGVTIPSAALTVPVENLMRMTEEGKPEQTEIYRRSEIAREYPYQRDYDQFIVNLAKGQGLPQAFQSNPKLVGALDTLPGEGDEWAWWLGAVGEAPVWATPVGAVKPVATGVRAAGRGASRVGMKKTGEALEAVSAPLEYMKYSATRARLDQALEATGTEKKTKDIIEGFYEQPWSKDDWFDKTARRNYLNEVAPDALATRVQDTVNLRALLDSGGVDVDDLAKSQTAQAIIDEIKIDTGVRPTRLTRANAGTYVTREQNMLKAAAAADEEFAQLYNLAEEQARQIKDGRAFDPTQVKFNQVDFEARPAQRLNTGKMNIEMQNELARVVLAKEIASGRMGKKEVGRFFMWANLDKGARQKDELTKIILEDPKRGGKLGLNTTTASVDDMMNASRNVLSKRAREQMRNFLPEDLVVLAGDVVVNARTLKNRKAMANFRDTMKDNWSKIKYEDGIFKVDPVYRMELVSDVIEYVGIETVRQSDRYRDLLNQLTAEMSFTPEHMKVVNDSMVHDAAKIHLDATRLRSGGEQYRRASQPLETRGDILALSEEKEFIPQLQKGAMGELKRDFVKSFKTIVNRNKENPPFAKDLDGPEPPPAFRDLVRNVDSELDKVQDNFQREWVNLTKETGSPVTALDDMSAETWGALRDDRIRQVDETVNRPPFNGSYKEYMDHFVKPDYRDQILSLLNVKSLQQITEEAGEEATEEAVKELVHDYALYFTKKDEWTAMLRKFYGTAVSEEVVEPLIRTLIHVEPNAARRLSGRQFVDMQPKASTILDPNFSNFVVVVKRAEERLKSVRGKGLTSLGKQQTVAPVMEWILGNRRAAVVARNQIEFMDTNPAYRVELFPDHYSVGMEVNLAPLGIQYEDMFVDAINSLRTRGVPVDTAAAGRAMRGLGARLANIHFNTVSAIPAGNRADVLNQLNKLIMEQGTINPSVASMQKQLQRELEIPKAIMDRAVRDEALKVIGNVEGVGDAIKNMQDKTWRLFFEDRPIDSRYHAEPSLSVVQDMLHNMKQFYKTNGLAISGKMENSLSANHPLFKKVRGTNDLLVYGEAQMSMVRKLDELAASTRIQTTLDRAGEEVTAGVARTVGDSVDYVRRAATQGLLAGVFAPNLRYMGQNILTAPFIMMATVGLSRSAGALSFGAQSVFQSLRSYIPTAMMAKTASDDMVLVVSKSGRRYTAKELRNLENKYNLGITRSQAELYATDARSVYRAVGLAGRGSEMSGIERLANFVDPGQRTLFSHAADAQDMAFRRATFYSALADDMPIDQALRLSKRSLLDYGAMAPWEKKYAARYTWFWSFRRQMTGELINALHKSVVGGAGHQYMARVWRAQMRQQQGEGSWLYNEDRAKARLYSVWKAKIDGLDQFTYGYSNPTVEQFESLLSLFSMGSSIMYGDQKMSEAVKKFVDTGNWSPLLSFIVDSVTETHSRTVPPEYIALAKSLGQWEWMQQRYRITARPTRQRRQGDPVYGARQQQFVFMDQDAASEFAVDNLYLMGAGLQRTLRDYSRAAIAGDMLGDEDDDYKRFSLPTFTTYALGLETSVKSYDIKALSPQGELKIQRELEKLYKNP